MSEADWKYTQHNRNEALRRLRTILAADGPIRQHGHFKGRCRERKFSFVDAVNALERGQILREGEPDLKSGEIRYAIETDKMVIAFAFDEEGEAITLVTGWWKEDGRKL